MRRAREILTRWQSSSILDQIHAAEGIPAVATSRQETGSPPAESGMTNKAASQPPREIKSEAPQNDNSESGSAKANPVVQGSQADRSAVDTAPRTHDSGSVEQTSLPEGSTSGPINSEKEPAQFHPAKADSESKEEDRREPESKSSSRVVSRVARARRVGPVNPAPTNFSGSPVVKRKLRIDVPTRDSEALRAQSANEAQQNSGSANTAADAPATSDQPSADGSTEQASPAKSNAAEAQTSRRIRIDSSQSVQDLAGASESRIRGSGRPKRRYVDEPHASFPPGPHFEISSPPRSNLTSLTGQFLAYTGVLGLTIGTAIVIYGHFGGASQYTPTGWLVTTVAQMLLFLGVINLVSGGIEQNNEDVSRRINSIGEQLMRIELVAEQAMRGPKMPVERFVDPSTAESATERQTADIPRQ